MCERCKKFEEHIEDLRNKYGSIHTYMQIFDTIEYYESTSPKLFKLLAKAEIAAMASYKQFAELLKKEI